MCYQHPNNPGSQRHLIVCLAVSLAKGTKGSNRQYMSKALIRMTLSKHHIQSAFKKLCVFKKLFVCERRSATYVNSTYSTRCLHVSFKKCSCTQRKITTHGVPNEYGMHDQNLHRDLRNHPQHYDLQKCDKIWQNRHIETRYAPKA